MENVQQQMQRSVLFQVIMQGVVVISYQHFGTTYRSHVQGSVRNYRYSLRNNPEKHSSHYFTARAWNHAISNAVFIN